MTTEFPDVAALSEQAARIIAAYDELLGRPCVAAGVLVKSQPKSNGRECGFEL